MVFYGKFWVGFFVLFTSSFLILSKSDAQNNSGTAALMQACLGVKQIQDQAHVDFANSLGAVTKRDSKTNTIYYDTSLSMPFGRGSIVETNNVKKYNLYVGPIGTQPELQTYFDTLTKIFIDCSNTKPATQKNSGALPFLSAKVQYQDGLCLHVVSLFLKTGIVAVTVWTPPVAAAKCS